VGADPSARRNRLVPLIGRDPFEEHRVATPLELLFDLTFVVVFRVTADELAHGIAADQLVPAGASFAFAITAICWAWTNYSWFSSAYDTDDWSHRATTVIQMAGVIVVATGLPDLFRSVEEGTAVDIGVVVAGYVVMRVAMTAQWLRVARQDHLHRRTAVSYVVWIGIAQTGWVALAFARPNPTVFFTVASGLFVIEALGPITAERRSGGTPWNPHHIAERYGLLTLIALGECLFGEPSRWWSGSSTTKGGTSVPSW
jgi:low temperature requirement protein LtrA